MKYLLIIFLSLIIAVNQPIYASDPTPNISNDKIDDVKDMVKQIVKSNNGDNKEIEPTSDKPKSFFGNITKIDEKSITITYKNKIQLIEVSDDTVYVDLKRNKSQLANFAAGQDILAMGYLKGDKSLDCKRIVATEFKSVVNDNQTISGQIVDISHETSIFTLTPNYNKNSPFQLKTDPKTKIVNLENKTVPSSQAIVNGKKIIAIIKPDPKLHNTYYAQKIIILGSSDNKTTLTPTKNP